jgi:hypothetical protein
MQRLQNEFANPIAIGAANFNSRNELARRRRDDNARVVAFAREIS